MWMGKSLAFPFHLLRIWSRHLQVPFNFQVALLLDLKCFLFLIHIIPYPQESPQHCFMFGAPKHHFPREMYLPKAVSEHPGCKSVGTRAESKEQRMDCGLKEAWIPWGCEMVWGCFLGFVIYNIFVKNWTTHPECQPNTQGVLCSEL